MGIGGKPAKSAEVLTAAPVRIFRTACKEILIGAIEVFERLLQRMDGRPLKPIYLRSEHRDFAALAGEIERPPWAPPFSPLIQGQVEHEPARTRDPRHLLRLFRHRVEAVGIGFTFDHVSFPRTFRGGLNLRMHAASNASRPLLRSIQ